MNTPKTDALNKHIHAMPKTTRDWIEWAAQYAELSRQLETQVQELREALEMLNNEFKRLPHSLSYRYTHTGKVDAILEKTK